MSLSVVKTIAAETVRRWLEIADVKLHRYRHWLHSTAPQFNQKMADIVRPHVNPPAGGAVYCIDERTGTQALEHIRPDWPTRPGADPAPGVSLPSPRHLDSIRLSGSGQREGIGTMLSAAPQSRVC